MEHTQYLGIDVGGTNVKMGIVDTQGNITNFQSYDTTTWLESGHFIERLGDAIALELFEHKNINKTGIGLPGTITRNRRTPLEITAIPELNNVPLVEMLEKRFEGHTFFLENDANAAALGEFYFGEEAIDENYIFITLGTGVGGAAIINRQVFLGGDGNAMEPGHIPSKNGRVLERNVGKKELLELANRMRASYVKPTVLPADGTISTTGLVVAATEKDALALAILDEVGEMLGTVLVGLIRILDIKTILIGGGISAAYEFVVPAITRELNHWLTPYYTKDLVLKKATLGNDAGLLGAASLCFDINKNYHTPNNSK